MQNETSIKKTLISTTRIIALYQQFAHFTTLVRVACIIITAPVVDVITVASHVDHPFHTCWRAQITTAKRHNCRGARSSSLAKKNGVTTTMVQAAACTNCRVIFRRFSARELPINCAHIHTRRRDDDDGHATSSRGATSLNPPPPRKFSVTRY